jgi:glutathione peroxidase
MLTYVAMRKAILAILALFPLAAGACPGLLDHKVTTLLDQPASLCQYQGKVLLVVNTASQCGYTPQYEGLEKLYRRYKDRGLVVLGFPSNDFGGQEPGKNAEIAQFCQVNFGVSFPMFSKTEVSGSKTNAFYSMLAKRTGSRPQWNFHKYLVDRGGERVAAFESEVDPGNPKLVAAIEKLLSAK